jgi:hypothetical protein
VGHLKNIFAKLKVSERTAAVNVALPQRQLLGAERDRRLDARGAARRDVGGQQRYHDHRRGGKSDWQRAAG